ncbi:MAG: PAS domain-containing protein [Methylotenera sp.]|nr:PAS domain-containing protein [Oligoflexia bacterium]
MSHTPQTSREPSSAPAQAPDHELLRDRVFLFLVAGIYSSWSALYQWMGVPQTRSDILGRLAVSLLPLLALVWSLVSGLTPRVLFRVTSFCMWLCTAHYFYLTAEHIDSTTYIIGTFITVFAIGSYFLTRTSLRAYALFSIFLTLLMPSSATAAYPKLLFVSGMMTAVLVFYYAASARFQLLDHERESRERITELFTKLTEERVRLQEGQELAKVGNWEWKPGDATVLWSEELFRIYELPNLSGNLVAENTYFGRLHPDDLHLVEKGVQEAIAERKSYSFEHRILLDGGRIKWVLAKGRPVCNEAGELITLRGVAQDVTEQKNAKEQLALQQAKSMTSAKMAGLGQMAGGVAHEINNPLTIIYGKAEQLVWLAKKSQVDSELVEDTAKKIKETVIRISKIVKSLRAFSREGSQDPFQITQIGGIIQDTVELCHQKLRHHGVEFRVLDAEASEERIECRPVEISQVLLNLLNNSFDAIMGLSEKWIELRVVKSGDHLLLTLTDSGSGIPGPVREKLFEPFFTTKEVGKGTGLGLSVSKGIIESHGGSMKIDHDSPHTRFVIRLPVRQSSSS